MEREIHAMRVNASDGRMKDTTTPTDEVAEPEAGEGREVLDLVDHNLPPVVVGLAEGVYGRITTDEEGSAHLVIALVGERPWLDPLRGLAPVDHLKFSQAVQTHE